MWWKRNKLKILLPVLIVLLLAAAFFFGGRAPRNSALPAPAGTAADTPVPAKTPEPAETQATGAAQKSGSDRLHAMPTPESKAGTSAASAGTVKHTCTISISCASILNNMDNCADGKKDLVPKDGWILKPVTVSFTEGESVFDVLERTCKSNAIHLEFESDPVYGSAYIEGIGNLYEFDVGELSGWMYKVNDRFPNYGCSLCRLKDGDAVSWVYTCDLGSDVGGGSAAG